MLTGIALCCGAALSLTCGTPRPVQPTPADGQPDIDGPALTVHSSIEAPGPQTPTSPEVMAGELDTVSTPFDLGIERIHALENGTSLRLRMPDDSLITLRPVASAEGDGTLVTTAMAGDLVSTITRRDRHFFATIAAPQASYRIVGTGEAAVAHRQRDLAARTTLMPVDYRRVQ